jgi:hypothetical protein
LIDINISAINQRKTSMMMKRKEKIPLKDDIYELCKKKRYDSSALLKCIELYPEVLAQSDNSGYLPLHLLLANPASTIEDALMMMEKYPAALQCPTGNVFGELPIHIECKNRCRSAILAKCIELCPDLLHMRDRSVTLPLNYLLENDSSSIDDALMMMEKYPKALEYATLHIECQRRCRSAIIAKCIELYPQALAIAGKGGCLPLHFLLINKSSSIEDVLMMMEKYPAALQHRNNAGELPLHMTHISAVIRKCIELYPEALAMPANDDSLPLHYLLMRQFSTLEDALMMIEKYPATLQHQNMNNNLPLHLECIYQARSPIIATSIEVYPQALSMGGEDRCLPLQCLLSNQSSSLDDALTMIEKYPAALQYRGAYSHLPLALHIECMNQCRSAIISKCIELYPQALAESSGDYYALHMLLMNPRRDLLVSSASDTSLEHAYRCSVSVILRCIELYPAAFDDKAIRAMTSKLDMKTFRSYAPLLVSVFTLYPTRLYHPVANIRRNPFLYRKVLNLLPSAVLTAHARIDASCRYMNWQSRSAVLMLLAKIKLQDRDRSR